jgi:hypothetical protein
MDHADVSVVDRLAISPTPPIGHATGTLAARLCGLAFNGRSGHDGDERAKHDTGESSATAS